MVGWVCTSLCFCSVSPISRLGGGDPDRTTMKPTLENKKKHTQTKHVECASDRLNQMSIGMHCSIMSHQIETHINLNL